MKEYRIQLLFIILLFLMIVGKSCGAQNKAELIKTIEAHGIKNAPIVYAQMMLESGNLNCSNCSWSNYNNPFGFHNGKRYLIYDNLEHALEGYKAWQVWRCPNCESESDYFDCLVKFWGAPKMNEYVNKLKQI